MSQLIVHVSEVDLTLDTGMGRVSCLWREVIEQRGYQFLHIGPQQVGQISHPSLFPQAAFNFYQKQELRPSLLLVHEPASGIFIKSKTPLALFSHGLERRAWNLKIEGRDGSQKSPNLKTRILFPIWRLRLCDLGVRNADLLFLINQEDCRFAQSFYHKKLEQIFIFKNGFYPFDIGSENQQKTELTILFNGSWIERKGIHTLVKAAVILQQRGLSPKWLLVGTGCSPELVLKDWAREIHPFIEVIPQFKLSDEVALLDRADLFVLPSFFEGQPLSLIQAMAAGKCCITTNCCGQRDLIQHGNNGLLHEPGDAINLAKLIEQCIADPSLRTTLGSKAKSSIEHRTWKTVSMEVVDRLETLLPRV